MNPTDTWTETDDDMYEAVSQMMRALAILQKVEDAWDEAQRKYDSAAAKMQADGGTFNSHLMQAELILVQAAQRRTEMRQTAQEVVTDFRMFPEIVEAAEKLGLAI